MSCREGCSDKELKEKVKALDPAGSPQRNRRPKPPNERRQNKVKPTLGHLDQWICIDTDDCERADLHQGAIIMSMVKSYDQEIETDLRDQSIDLRTMILLILPAIELPLDLIQDPPGQLSLYFSSSGSMSFQSRSAAFSKVAFVVDDGAIDRHPFFFSYFKLITCRWP
nr:hypothetical protein Iba_chr10aCG12230 [Ipomoea batatas]